MGLFDRKPAPPGPGAPAVQPGGYDFVEIRKPDGAVQRMTRSQFDAQLLPERVRILVEGTAVFFRGDVVVPASEALKGNR